MVLDDLHTRRVIYGVIWDAELKYGICFAQNNDPEAQQREMSE